MLDRRRRRWANIKTTLGQRLVFARISLMSGSVSAMATVEVGGAAHLTSLQCQENNPEIEY